jgi:2,3-bisphosphoglycerate-independent phosphoglycerate mutase
MFGYFPEEFPGRAYLHAIAADLPCEEGDALFMLNLVVVEKRLRGLYVVDGAPAPPPGVCSEWVERLNGLAPEGISLYHMGGIEILAVVEGGSRHLRPTDPFIRSRPVADLAPAVGWEGDDATGSTIASLKRLVSAVERGGGAENDRSPANLGLIMKWPSEAAAVEAFAERHGMRAAAVVSSPCFQGMGTLLSMRVETAEDGDAEAELRAKMGIARDLFREGWEFVFVHTKQADEAAHGGDPAAKKEVIASMDRALSGCDDMWRDEELLAVITCDHSTPTTLDSRVIHGGDPVPLLFHAATVRRDGLVLFDEVAAAGGGMGQLRGKDLMPMILYLARRADFYTGA